MRSYLLTYIHTFIAFILTWHAFIHVIYAYLHALIHAIHSYISCIHTFPYYHALLHSYIHSYMTCVHTFIAFIHVMHSYLHVMHSFLHAFIHTCIHAFITFILSMHMHSYMSCVHTFHEFILTCIHACHALIHVHVMSSYMSCMNGQRRENTFADVASHGHHSKISGLPDSLWHLKRFRFHFELDWMIVRVTRVLHSLILEMHMHPPNSREMSTSKWLWNFFTKHCPEHGHVYILKPLVFKHLFAGVLQSSGNMRTRVITAKIFVSTESNSNR